MKNKPQADLHPTNAPETDLLHEFDSVHQVLKTWPDAPAPDLAARVLDAVKPPAWRKPMAIAAGLLLLLGATWFFAKPTSTAIARADPPEPDAAREWIAAAPSLQDAPISIPAAAAVDHPAVKPLDQATAWLLAAQDADGGWSMGRTGAAANYNVGLSALALLALMSKHDPTSNAEQTTAVQRGLEFLLAQQDAQSGLFGPNITGSLYNHTLACLALLESQDGATSTAWQAGLNRGLDLLIEHQQAEGGWSYLRARRGQPNSSLTTWALLALLEADARNVAHHPEEIARGLTWLEATIDQEGRAGYRRPGDHPHGSETLTAAAALCLSARSVTPRSPLDRMLKNILRDAGGSAETLDFYRTYFQTAALREAGLGDAPEMEQLKTRLESAQDRTSAQAGSWAAEDPWARTGGRVYSTALAMLALRDN